MHATLTTNKAVDGLLLNRTQKIFWRSGLDIPIQTLNRWEGYSHQLLGPFTIGWPSRRTQRLCRAPETRRFGRKHGLLAGSTAGAERVADLLSLVSTADAPASTLADTSPASCRARYVAPQQNPRVPAARLGCRREQAAS
jgi:hypothetical protein